jgi:APA family basic amino acid/polyamine antiporter
VHSPAPEFSSRQGRLARVLGFWALAASIVNVTIAGSIFVFPTILYTAMGPAAPLAFVLGALLFAPIVLCFAAAGSRITTSGGPYRYVDAAFGRFPAFLVGAIFWVSSVAGSAGIATVLVGQWARPFPILGEPVPRSVCLFVVYGLLASLNVRGIRSGAVATMGFAALKVLPLLLLAAVGLPHAQVENFRMVHAPSIDSIGTSLVIVVFAYSGIETALAPSGELKDPARVVPRAAATGVAAVILLYIALQVVTQGILGPSLLGNQTPIESVAARFIPGGDDLIVFTASVSLLGALQGDLLGSSRLLYALASDGHLPKALAWVSDRYRVPVTAILVHAGVGWLLASAGTFNELALVSGGTICMVYIATCATAWRLQRQNRTDTAAPFRLRGGSTIPLVGIAALTGVLTTLRRPEWVAIGSALLALTVLYGLTWRRQPPSVSPEIK